MSVCVDREEIDQTHNADRNEECERARERSERARAKREKTKNSRKNEKMRKYDLDERDRWIKEKSNSRTVTAVVPEAEPAQPVIRSPPRAVRQFPVPEAEEKEFDIQNIVDHDPPRIGRLEPEIAVHEVDTPV